MCWSAEVAGTFAGLQLLAIGALLYRNKHYDRAMAAICAPVALQEFCQMMLCSQFGQQAPLRKFERPKTPAASRAGSEKKRPSGFKAPEGERLSVEVPTRALSGKHVQLLLDTNAGQAEETGAEVSVTTVTERAVARSPSL